MEPVLAVATGCVFALAFQTFLQGHFLRMIIGLMLLSNGINLLIFTVGRLSRGASPIVPHEMTQLPEAANPLPQALILTAIVISFGVTAFSFSLAFRMYRNFGTLDTDALQPEHRADEAELDIVSPAGERYLSV